MPPRRTHVDHVRAICARRGIEIRRYGRRGFRLVGLGVDLLVADLNLVRLPADLAPFESRGAVFR